MMKSFAPMMAPPSKIHPATRVDITHYVDPHVWWQGGETIEFGTPAKHPEAAHPYMNENQITKCC